MIPPKARKTSLLLPRRLDLPAHRPDRCSRLLRSSPVRRSIPTSEFRFWAIFALPHSTSPAVHNDPKKLAEFEAREEESFGAQAKAFERLPSAKVVRLPFANHYVFFSNEADVLREMNAFIGSFPPPKNVTISTTARRAATSR
jgi:hypothetical protein